MAGLLPVRPCEITLPEGTLVQKLDLIGAMIDAVREAHRDEMSAASWRSLNEAQAKIADAILKRNERRLIEG